MDEPVPSAAAAHADEGESHRYDAPWVDQMERAQQRDRTGDRHAIPLHHRGGSSFLMCEPLGVNPSGLHLDTARVAVALDAAARFDVANGKDVLAGLVLDVFGLRPEQLDVAEGIHPWISADAALGTTRRQLHRLGVQGVETEVVTNEPAFLESAQRTFLLLFDTWYDTDRGRARRIDDLVAELDAGSRDLPDGRHWREMDDNARQQALLPFRLAYCTEAWVNWCPGLGTVLADEEVARSNAHQGTGMPVYRRRVRQWFLRTSAYADRLMGDLGALQWPASAKTAQLSHAERIDGMFVDLAVDESERIICAFSTRPELLFGATFVEISPRHPLVDAVVDGSWPEGIPTAWTGALASATPRAAITAFDAPTGPGAADTLGPHRLPPAGVFTGFFAVSPANQDRLPIFVTNGSFPRADVATLGVPAHDDRSFAFARRYRLPVVGVIEPPPSKASDHDQPTAPTAESWQHAFTGEGTCTRSHTKQFSLDGLPSSEARTAMSAWLETNGSGRSGHLTTLADWSFGRQRFWGVPISILWDDDGHVIPLQPEDLPVRPPSLGSHLTAPPSSTRSPQPSLRLAPMTWQKVLLQPTPTAISTPPAAVPDATDESATEPQSRRHQANRELLTMTHWMCASLGHLRALAPQSAQPPVDAAAEQYWSHGTTCSDELFASSDVATTYLLYARFVHKVLFDLGEVSTSEPFAGVVIHGDVLVERPPDWRSEQARSMHNARTTTTPIVDLDEVCERFGADSVRLALMNDRPPDASQSWSEMRLIDQHRFLQRLWATLIDESTGSAAVKPAPTDSASTESTALLFLTEAVRTEAAARRFDRAIGLLRDFVERQAGDRFDRATAEGLVLLLFPFVPHVARELWSRLGRSDIAAATLPPTTEPTGVADVRSAGADWPHQR
jgi:leucyl-tRNA synthetase